LPPRIAAYPQAKSTPLVPFKDALSAACENIDRNSLPECRRRASARRPLRRFHGTRAGL